MTPDTNQYLRSIHKALQTVILPELTDKPFAREQASMVLSSLSLLIEIQQFEPCYLRQEYKDICALLKHWAFGYCHGGSCDSWEDISGIRCEDLEFDEIQDIKATMPRLKAGLRALMDSAMPQAESVLHKMLHAYICRQLEREKSLLRKTGFIPEGETLADIGKTLAHQGAFPLLPRHSEPTPQHQPESFQ